MIFREAGVSVWDGGPLKQWYSLVKQSGLKMETHHLISVCSEAVTRAILSLESTGDPWLLDKWPLWVRGDVH